jgi:hypothetical protein
MLIRADRPVCFRHRVLIPGYSTGQAGILKPSPR